MATMDEISIVFRKMTMKASDSPLMNLIPNKGDLPKVFHSINYIETRKGEKPGTGNETLVDYTDILPKEKGKRGRRKRFLEGEGLSPPLSNSEQCLPLKKRHKLLCAAALSLPAILPQMSPISVSDVSSTQSVGVTSQSQATSSNSAGVVTTNSVQQSEKRKVGRPRKQPSGEEQKTTNVSSTAGWYRLIGLFNTFYEDKLIYLFLYF